MKTIIVGGNFGETPKESKIINTLGDLFANSDVLNGGTLDDIVNVDLSPYDLVLWFPNMSNEIEKIYPRKKQGAVLVCSKVMREGYTDADAISRIFRMGANAVTAITTTEKPFKFKLMDALGNAWVDTDDLVLLGVEICSLFYFTKESIRFNSKSVEGDKVELSFLEDFVDLNKKVADKSEAMGGRYFGNCSTRCEKLFPSTRITDGKIVVSKRNVDKSRLTTDDLVICSLNDDSVIEYYGEAKPSVDTPIQISLYHRFPEIKYMIHGHYFIKEGIMTDDYFPCGDMREYKGLKDTILKNKYEDTFIGYNGIINLKNHGFLLYAESLDMLKELVDGSTFIKKELGSPKI